MRILSLFTIAILVSGCAGSPPEPPKCQGDFRPLNIEQKGASVMTPAASAALCGKGGSYAAA